MILFKKTILLLLLSFFIFSISPNLTYAAKDTGGLVPCAGDSTYANRCTLCDLLVGIRDIVAWGKTILIILAVLAIVIGAIMYIISMGDSGAMESAKNVIKQALWGVVIVLGAWLIVNTVLWLFAKKAGLGVGVTNWYDFQCEGGGDGGDGDGGDGGGGGGGGTVPDEPTTCTSFIYSTWSECESGSQFRIITSQRPSGCTGGNPGPLTQSCSPGDSGDEKIPEACKPYETASNNASGGDSNLKCLMVGIAMSESACNSSAQGGSGCGLMQIEGGDCDYWKGHPEESVAHAAQMIKDNAAALEKYKSTFSIGNNINQSGKEVTYGNYKYDTGNDDLIASYNGGTGGGTNGGVKQPFAVSSDCPSPPTPAWQCHINPVGFNVTQTYVKNVQGYQNNCLGK